MSGPLERYPITGQEFVPLFSYLVIDPEKSVTDGIFHLTTGEMRQTVAQECIQARFGAVIGNAP
jgi:hypothetical protein